MGPVTYIRPPSKNTRLCDNVARSQRRTTNTQRCSKVDATTSKLQRCSKVVSKLHSQFKSRCTMNVYWKRCCSVEITTSNSQRLHNIDNATSYSQSRYWDIANNVKCGLLIFTWLHFHNLTSKLWISLITIRHFWYAFQILSIIPLWYSKSSKIAFKRFRDMKIDNLQPCIQELLKNNSRFRFWEHKETIKSNCKATNTFKEGDVIKHCR